jgi:hypothetical protein
MERLKRGGVDTIRLPINWGGVETIPGVFEWTSTDRLIENASRAGIEVLPFLNGAPLWAVRQVSVNPASHSFAPQNLPVRTEAQRAGWQTFVGEAVARYGPGGHFWQANPGLPQRPISTWQIWNEPNFKYFVALPNPVEYGKLVKLSYTAIKGVDPGAQLILGGLFARPKEATYKTKPRQAYFATEFLEQMYRKTPGIKGKFSGIAIHPYSYKYQTLTPIIEEVRAVLRKSHDPNKGLWITEMGWSSGFPSASNGNNGYEKGPQGQVKQLTGAFSLLERNYVKWQVRRVFWFSVDDQASVCNFCDGSGLFGPGFIAKPSWRAYVKFAGGTAG